MDLRIASKYCPNFPAYTSGHDVDEIVKQLDQNGSGKLSAHEVKRCLKTLGLKPGNQAVAFGLVVRLQWEEVLSKLDSLVETEIDLRLWAEALSKELQNLIKVRLEECECDVQVVDMLKVFRQFDTDDSGLLNRAELTRAMAALGLKAKGFDPAVIMDKMDSNHDGMIDLMEWKNSMPPELYTAIVEKLGQDGVVQGFVDDGRNRRFTKVFNQFDTDRSGTISAKELKRAMKALGLKADSEAVSSMLGALDSNGDGQISVQEWALELPEELKVAIESKLTDAGTVEGFLPLVDLLKVFNQFDTDASGTLCMQEVKNALKILNLEQQGIDVQTMLSKMDINKDGEIDMKEWKANMPREVYQAITAKLDTTTGQV
ncbi:hypothetical protein CYMTET_17733 [Cymbomonas tetramitiformis]|uniref:EF-hand domain-containing protein n=1 Tax=Cymbomonas tetramitiformis TaxID=36881 RepID=A0AAE0G9G6_9CHLO|nr:hypothetical protein CYMTET_17733 [Cymbomonas tetramitiformis]